MTGRRLWAVLHLLDRQLVDRDGDLAGNVDDLELEVRGEHLYVTGICTGPGTLARRMGSRRLSAWLERVQGTTPVPFTRVADLDNHVRLSVARDEISSFATERWVRDHVIAHVPGSGHAAE
jgi:hypothetical protein